MKEKLNAERTSTETTPYEVTERQLVKEGRTWAMMASHTEAPRLEPVVKVENNVVFVVQGRN
jgi:hypothetical protein